MENRPGAFGTVGLQACANSDPDGYTFCALPVGNLTIIPHYDPSMYARYQTLVPVSELVRGVGVVFANSNVPAKDLREFAELARKKPSGMRYASFGPGSSPQFVFEWLKNSEKIDIQHIPYKGASDALTSVLAGQVDASYAGLGVALAHIRSGALKALAVLGDERTPLLPDVPSMAELGYKFPEMKVWFGLAAPRGTPPEALEAIADAVRIAIKDPDIRAKYLDPEGSRPVGSSPSEFAETIKSEFAQGAELVKQSGVRAQ